MRIRMRETGSLFLRGEELVAFRYRRKHPPAWMRVWVALFFCLIPFGMTYKMMVTPHHLVLAAWSVAGLFWLIAIAVTIDMARPRSERQWTGFVVSGAFGALAVMAVVAVIRHGDHKAYDWFFPLLLSSLSGSFAVATVCDGRKKSADAPRAGL
jgi:peptidoglycan/LPS O-acetylase OafA/YrhL